MMKKLKFNSRIICERCQKLLFSPEPYEAKWGVCNICLRIPISSEDFFDELFEFDLLDSPQQ